MKQSTLSFASYALASLLAFGCAAGSDDEDDPGGSSADGGSGGEPSDGGQGGGTGGGFQEGGGGGTVYMPDPEVFGHSKDTLYKLNPETKDVGIIGPFVGCTDIVDLAIDEASNLFASTNEAIYSVDKTTAECTLLAEGSYPNSLSFVPAGTLDPDEEALVGFLDDQYVRIDVQTGDVTNIGSPWNNGFISSGDVVSVKNGPTFLTIKDDTPDGTECRDCLVEINPATGVIVKEYHSIGYEKVFGAAFWAGSVYGFTNEGEIFEIVINGGAIETTPIGTPPGLSFWGAGSSTSAPAAPQ